MRQDHHATATRLTIRTAKALELLLSPPHKLDRRANFVENLRLGLDTSFVGYRTGDHTDGRGRLRLSSCQGRGCNNRSDGLATSSYCRPPGSGLCDDIRSATDLGINIKLELTGAGLVAARSAYPRLVEAAEADSAKPAAAAALTWAN